MRLVSASGLVFAILALPSSASAALRAGYPQIAGHPMTDEELANVIAQLAGGLPAGQTSALKRFGLTSAQGSYSRSPAASRASDHSVNSSMRTILPSRTV